MCEHHLMHSQVAHITKKNNIGVFALAITADTTNGIFIYNWTKILILEFAFFLQSIHQ